jgi:hypothetical protein
VAGTAARLRGNIGRALVGAVCTTGPRKDLRVEAQASKDRNARWLSNTAKRRANTSRTT